MKRSRVFLGTVCCLGAIFLTPRASAADREMTWGGLGFARVGIVAGFSGSLGHDLETTLGKGAAPGGYFPTFGGGGWTLMGGRLMLGGGGFAIHLPSDGGQNGTASIWGGGGGFKLGYAVINNENWLGFPYIGMGGCGIGMKITNESKQAIAFGDDQIAPGAEREYSGGYVYYEFGFGVQRLLMWGHESGQGGFTLGAELGFLVSSFNNRFESQSGLEVGGVDAVRVNGGFMNLTIGGGGFFSRDQ